MTFTDNDLAAELVKMYPPVPQRKPGGVTIGEMAKIWGCTFRSANDRLDTLVDRGVLYSERAMGDKGLAVKVYYKV